MNMDAPGLISAVNSAAPIVPEPPLLMFIIPLAAIFCFRRPDRRKRVPRLEPEELPIASSRPAAIEYPRLPTGLRR